MCTVTWTFGRNGYDMLFNRDELRSRKPGVPPAIKTLNGIRYIAPLDRNAGGTWIGVNEFGVSFCLLNFYAGKVKTGSGFQHTSRGLFVSGLFDAEDITAVKKKIEMTDLSRYKPLVLIAIDGGRHPLSLTWTGTEVKKQFSGSIKPPFSSSSFNTGPVIASRKQIYNRRPALRQSPRPFLRPSTGTDCTFEELYAYHRSHIPRRGPYSVCMHRADAKTVSFTHVSVSSDRVSMRYAAGSPCRAKLGRSIELERRAPSFA